jgi:hypothetical protein
MNAVQRERVRELREANPALGLSTAVSIAKYETNPPVGRYTFLADLGGSYSRATGTVDGFDVRVDIVPDEDAELGRDDVSGTFVHEADEHTITNTHRDWNADAPLYRPSNYRIEQGVKEFIDQGMSAGQAADAYRAAVEKDMADDASRVYHGVTVTISFHGERLHEGSMWGIDTIDGYDGRSYFIETAVDLIDTGLDEIHDTSDELIEQANVRAQVATEWAQELHLALLQFETARRTAQTKEE